MTAAASEEGRGGPDLDRLIAGLRERQPRDLARAISLVEDAGALRRELIRRIYPETGRAAVIGVTGPPGAGKSTLVDRLARLYRRRGERVGILAVDPTSPFSGGAILGDRIRMQQLYTDPEVFIRSMATRGAMGGLAAATRDAVDLLDAAGFERILVETVGVGQDEVDVVRCVDTVLLVTLPGLGDDIQAIKAGIMEIADLFVVNKADREGVEGAVRDLEMLLGMGESEGWRPPVLRTVASQGEGVEEVAEEIERHRAWLVESGELEVRRRLQLRVRVENLLKERVLSRAEEILDLKAALDRARVEKIDPYRVADSLFAGVVESERSKGEAAAAGEGR